MNDPWDESRQHFPFKHTTSVDIVGPTVGTRAPESGAE